MIGESTNFAPRRNGISRPRNGVKFAANWSFEFARNSVKGDGNASVDFDVPFPQDYSELLEQVNIYNAIYIWTIWHKIVKLSFIIYLVNNNFMAVFFWIVVLTDY